MPTSPPSTKTIFASKDKSDDKVIQLPVRRIKKSTITPKNKKNSVEKSH